MKTPLFRTIIMFGLTFLILTFTALPVAAAARTASSDFAQLDAFLQSQMQANLTPGLAVSVIHGTQIMHMRGFGTADPTGRAVTPQTPFILGSLSKSFTALAIMQLVEAGKVHLDDPVKQYLPWFTTTNASATARITVRQLLNHDSGLQDDPSSISGFSTEQRLQQYLHRVALDRPVDSSFEYANINYILLGQIIQRVSGEPYATYIQQHIFSPLQMSYSYASVPQARQAGLAQGYTWRFGVPVPSDDFMLNMPTVTPAGLLASTVEDMSHYLVAQMNAGRYGDATVLSPAGIMALHTPPNQPVLQPHPYPYAMGWAQGTLNGTTILDHEGATFSFNTFMIIVPQTRWAGVILTNANATPTSFRNILRGFLGFIIGKELAPAGPSTSTFYLIIDSLLVLMLVIVLLLLGRLPRWYRQLVTRPGIHRWQALVPLLWEVVLPALLLLIVPKLIFLDGTATWLVSLLLFPDVTWTSLVLITLWLLAGVIRAVLRSTLLLRRERTIPPAREQLPQPSFSWS